MPKLRVHYLEQAHPRRLRPDDRRFDDITRRHREAIARGEPCYTDPATGFSVFTAAFLADRGQCCDSGCRHCPFLVD